MNAGAAAHDVDARRDIRRQSRGMAGHLLHVTVAGGTASSKLPISRP